MNMKTHKGMTIGDIAVAVKKTINNIEDTRIKPSGVLFGGNWKHVLGVQEWLVDLRIFSMPNNTDEVYIISDIYAPGLVPVELEHTVSESIDKILRGGGITARVTSIFNWETKCELIFEDAKVGESLAKLSGYHRYIDVGGRKHSLACHDGEVFLELAGSLDEYADGETILSILSFGYGMLMDYSVINAERDDSQRILNRYEKVLNELHKLK